MKNIFMKNIFFTEHNKLMYCIWKSDRQDRFRLLQETSKKHGVQWTYIPAIIPDDKDFPAQISDSKDVRKEHLPIYACLFSHQKAMDRALDDMKTGRNPTPFAVIFEDDVWLRDQFLADLSQLQKEIPPYVGFLLLSPFVTKHPTEIVRSWRNKTGDQVWSLAGYMVSRQGLENRQGLAASALCSIPLTNLQAFASERIFSQGKADSFFVYPPMVIENCLTPSSLTPQNDPYHIRYWNYFKEKDKFY